MCYHKKITLAPLHEKRRKRGKKLECLSAQEIIKIQVGGIIL